MQSKQELRTSMKEKLHQMSSQQIFSSSEKIIQELMPLIDKYQVRAIFLPMKSEPQIQSFIKLLLAHGKQTIVPQSDGNILVPIIYDTSATLYKGKYGNQEIKNPIPYIGDIDIILVPGLAFSSDGKRLGRGGGGYDTFLAQYPKAKKIGLCFTGQLVDDVPMSEHDIKVDKVISL